MHDWERPPKRSDRRMSGVRGSQLPRAVSGRPLMELQALQRTAGNAAVARLVEVPPVARTPPVWGQ
jgi:hypothetical protein